MTTEVFEQDVAMIEGRSVADVLDARNKAMWLLEFAKQMKSLCDDALLKHLVVTGPVESGDNLYIAAEHRKDVKCRDPGKTLDALFKATGGDFGEVEKCLAANAFKHGACRLPLGGEWEKHFDVVLVPFVKDGVTAKQLVTINKQFLK